ncbi:hypothetical protein EHM92_06980 [bacterium]|nr:MAG: hypothetical protein EHM92_06980 [bacterium]
MDENLTALLVEEDTNADKLITIADHGVGCFSLWDADGRSYFVEGVYPLGNLLQEFGLALRSGRSGTEIRIAELYDPPPCRVSRMIR